MLFDFLMHQEQGVRTPGPEEIKSLARALDVSPAYLMCLSDTSQSRSTNNPSQLIPLLDHRQACDAPLYLNMIREHKQSDDVVYISVSTALLPELSANAFALKMVDESMIPEIRVNDVLIVVPDIQRRPGDFVVALLESEQSVIIRKYKQLSATRDAQQYELVALNEDWADIRVDSSDVAAQIIGCGVSLIRSLQN